MKFSIIMALLIFVVSCSDSSSPKVEKKEQEISKKSLPSSPEKVAIEFLNAYKMKDLGKVKSLSGRMVSLNFSERNFNEKIIKLLNNWDGTVKDIKYTYGLAKTLAGVIPFAEIDKDTIYALSLTYTGEKWIFSIEGFKKIKKEIYKDYIDQVLSGEVVAGYIPGSWKCIKKLSSGKLEPQEVLEQLEYIFNEDHTVIIKKVGIVAKGQYEIENNLIKIRNIKKDDPKNRKFIGKRMSLILKDSTTMLLSNDYTFAIFKK